MSRGPLARPPDVQDAVDGPAELLVEAGGLTRAPTRVGDLGAR